MVPVEPGQYIAVVVATDGVKSETKKVRLNAVAAPVELAGSNPGRTGGVSVVPGPATLDTAPNATEAVTARSPLVSSGATVPSHDNGLENGENPKSFVRDANPGRREGNQ
jgi:hypothetical protein